ncbi:hypothetical protein FACS189425_01870 [Clostridia bacterium]|nr:hypothetical protein FACS189425_01870 [Clostridia bacterium]
MENVNQEHIQSLIDEKKYEELRKYVGKKEYKRAYAPQISNIKFSAITREPHTFREYYAHFRSIGTFRLSSMFGALTYRLFQNGIIYKHVDRPEYQQEVAQYRAYVKRDGEKIKATEPKDYFDITKTLIELFWRGGINGDGAEFALIESVLNDHPCTPLTILKNSGCCRHFAPYAAEILREEFGLKAEVYYSKMIPEKGTPLWKRFASLFFGNHAIVKVPNAPVEIDGKIELIPAIYFDLTNSTSLYKREATGRLHSIPTDDGMIQKTKRIAHSVRQVTSPFSHDTIQIISPEDKGLTAEEAKRMDSSVISRIMSTRYEEKLYETGGLQRPETPETNFRSFAKDAHDATIREFFSSTTERDSVPNNIQKTR